MSLWKRHVVERFTVVMILAMSTTVGSGSRIHAETHYIPAINFSERYDSNVFYTAKEFVPPDAQQWDLVSTLSTALKVVNKSRVGDTEATASVNGNVYAYNTNLSYVS